MKITFTPWKLLDAHEAAFPRAKFLCHISHALQSLLTDFCGIITVNLYSRTDTDAKWINNNYNFGINVAGHAIFGKENLVVYLKLELECNICIPGSLCMHGLSTSPFRNELV